MSLHGTYDDDNIFAKILRGDMPAVKVYEDDTTLAFMDVFPQSKGHTLVIPKTPARNILELGEEALQDLIVKVKKIATAVEKALKPDGIVVMQFNGAPAGQTVYHIHFHVLPRYDGVAQGPHGGAGPMADMNELKALAEKIKGAL